MNGLLKEGLAVFQIEFVLDAFAIRIGCSYTQIYRSGNPYCPAAFADQTENLQFAVAEAL